MTRIGIRNLTIGLLPLLAPVGCMIPVERTGTSVASVGTFSTYAGFHAWAIPLLFCLLVGWGLVALFTVVAHLFSKRAWRWMSVSGLLFFTALTVLFIPTGSYDLSRFWSDPWPLDRIRAMLMVGSVPLAQFLDLILPPYPGRRGGIAKRIHAGMS